MNQEQILKELNYKKNDILGSGMECLVLANKDGTVSKIYPKNFNLHSIERLKNFYQSLNINNFSLKTPLIHEIKYSENYLIVVENKLEGKSVTKEILNNLEKNQIKLFFNNYVDILFKIKNIKSQYLKNGECLDNSGRFYTSEKCKNWKELLEKSLDYKYNLYKNSFIKYINNFENKYLELKKSINKLPESFDYLIHGDFYPGNLLINKKLEITSIIDFGLATAKGDYLFDIATGWIFSDMFDEISKFNIKEYVFDKIKLRLNSEELKRIYLYILLFSFLSGEIYSEDESDGHFLWCVDNLNIEEYWNKLI